MWDASGRGRAIVPGRSTRSLGIRMWKSWLAAAAVMIGCISALYALLPRMSNDLWLFLGWVVPVLGAAVASYIAPRSKFNVGASTFVLALLVFGLGGYIAGEVGVGDAIGFQGEVFVTLISAPLVALASAVGALLGEWASKGKANA